MPNMNNTNQVVCVKRGQWHHAAGEFKGQVSFGPAFNQIVTIISVRESRGKIYFEFQEIPNHMFDSQWFKPLVDDTVLAEELNSIFSTVAA